MHARKVSTRVMLMAVGVSLLVFGMLAAPLYAADEAKPAKPAIGSPMPDFKLKDTQGKEHTLSQYKGKIVVLDFCSQLCPWSRGADPDLSALEKQYRDKGVVFLGIDSHNATKPEEIKQYATEKSITFPILKDEENKYADAVSAQRTPEIFIVDKDGKLAYHGAFDNRRSESAKGDTNYVSAALDSLLAGQPVAKTEVSAWGCSIKRMSSGS